MYLPIIATLSDFENIIQMVAEFYNEENYPFKKIEISKNLKSLLTNSSIGTIFLINNKDQPVGYCMIINSFCLELGGKIGYIDELFIKNEYRCNGLSTYCLNYIIESYRLSNYATLRLELEEDNSKAEALYKRLGFKTHMRKLMSYQL